MPTVDHVPDEMMHGAQLPTGTEVASYASHPEAQAAVDYLSQHDFDIRDVTIVGVDPHLVEHITGRLTPTRVALSGATNGLLWGAFFGLMMSFLNESLPGNGWIAVGLAVGATMGMLLALVSYMMRGGRRDFVSHTHVIAARYAILAERDAQKAFDLLQKTPENQRRPNRVRPRSERPAHNGPTEYGSRPDEKPRFGVRLSSNDEAAPAGSSEHRTSSGPSDTGADSVSTSDAPDAASTPTRTPIPTEGASVENPLGSGNGSGSASGDGSGSGSEVASPHASSDPSDEVSQTERPETLPVDNPYAAPKE